MAPVAGGSIAGEGLGDSRPLSPWTIPAILGALWTLAFAGFAPTPFQGIDYVRFYEPYQHFLRESILRGELPWWNPYSSLGRPFLADLQAAGLYPATLLIVVLGAKAGWVAGTFIHGMIAARGMIRLAGTLGASAGPAALAAAAFLFCGPVIARMQEGEVNYVYALCYLPWVLLLSARLAEAPSRQGWVALALTFALQLACGHPQIFWLSAIASGLFTTGWLAFSPWGASWRRWLRTEILLLGASIAAMALLGIVLVPFLELVTQSNRAHASLPFSGSFSMEGIQWLSLLWPTWGAFGVNWEYNLFVGPAVAVGGLVAFARWREPAVRGLIVLAAGGALIAAGSSTPLFRVLYAVVPGMHSFRVPARAGILITAALILGAAMAADRKGPGRRAAAGLCLAVLAGVVLYAAAHQADPGATTWLAFQAALACLAGAGWWLWIGAGGGHGPSARAGGAVLALALLLSLGLSVFGIKRSYRFQTEFPGEATVLEAVHAGKADLMAAPARVCVDSTVFRENAGMVYHVASVIGYESLSLGRVWDYLHLAAGADPSHPYSTIPDGRIINAAPSLRSFNLSVSLPLGSDLIKVEHSPDPRAYLATRLRIVPDSRAAIEAMDSGEDFHGTALVEPANSNGLDLDSGRTSGSATVTHFALSEVDVAVQSPGRALLVVAEAWYPGWTADIGGRPVPCIPVNDWMRGVPVPAGTSVVHMRFRQEGLASGAAVSALAAIALLAMWLPGRDFRRSTNPN